MKLEKATNDLETRAAEALKAVLGQVSSLKLKEMWRGSQDYGHGGEILAHVDVFGRPHILACEVKTHCAPAHLKAALRELQTHAAQRTSDATPVLIAPYLSPQAQALCKESHADYLDLAGNARLTVGEIFIGTRSMPHRKSAVAQSAH